MTARTESPTLAGTILAGSNPMVRNVLLAVVGSMALWLSAKVQVPFYPVPQTMQTFMILVIGMAFGWRLGAATVLLYLAQGAMGMPVFAGTPERGIGLAYMMGPTGGYLVGFVLAAVVVGFLGERRWDRNVLTTLLAMTIGTAIIFGCGVLWLGTLIGWDKPVLALGVTPFLLGAAAKIALAAAVLPLAWRLVGTQR
ncbi:MAG: biotin transporter BioY [Devosia sp.]